MLDMGLITICLVFNVMVGKLCELGKVKEANEMLTLLMERGFSPDETTYSLLVSGYGTEGEAEEVVKLYHEVRYRKLPCGSLLMRSLIKSLCQRGMFDEAEKYLKTMKDCSSSEDIACCKEEIRRSSSEECEVGMHRPECGISLCR